MNENVSLLFPQPLYGSPEKKLILETSEEIYPWYRKVNLSYNDWERECMYLRTGKKIVKTQKFIWDI